VKVTVDLDADLYRSLQVEAARTDRSVRDVLNDAVQAWLDREEDAEDRASAADALAEYGPDR
jgi:predicted transcriptional regulator